MKDKIRQLLEERAKEIHDARALVEAAETENRDLTSEEQANYDRHFDAAEKLHKRAENMERAEQAAAELGSGLAGGTGDPPAEPIEGAGAEGQAGDERMSEEYRAAYEKYLRITTRAEELGALTELRDLQADIGSKGGFLVPEQLVRDLIKAIDDRVYMRQWSEVLQMRQAETLGVPTLDSDPSDADWTSELATGSEDTAMAIGKRELHPHPLAKRLKVSKKLLRSSVLNVDRLVRDRLAYKFSVSQEKAFLQGHGAQQPLGVFTAATEGISTARDVTVGSTPDVTMNGWIDVKYALKEQYWPRSKWLLHRDVAKKTMKLRDEVGGAGTGTYLWQPSVQAGQPDRLLNIPVFMSEFAPNSFLANAYVAVLGDFKSGYWIVDALNMELQVLTELYAEANQNGYIGRLETDGMPVLEEAFSRAQIIA